MKKKIVDVLGIPFLCTTMSAFMEQLKQHVQKEEKTFVVTGNPEIVMYAQEDSEYNQIMHEADYVTADGIGVIRGAQLLGTPLPERVAGFDIMTNLLAYGNEKKRSAYFVGATPENIQKAVKTIQRTYPNLEIAGYHHGYFRFDEDTHLIEAIQEKQPDFIFVGLGFPRQEKWIKHVMPQCQKGIFMGVGGSFDVFAGTIKRAPLFWQKLNLEWFYRLIKQPSRWRRMLVLPKFLVHVMKEKAEVKKAA